jgi:hypothetical protein
MPNRLVAGQFTQEAPDATHFGSGDREQHRGVIEKPDQ